MVVPLEDVVDQRPALLRDPLAAALQILLEPLLGREGDLDFAEGEIVGHGGEVDGQRSEVRRTKSIAKKPSTRLIETGSSGDEFARTAYAMACYAQWPCAY